MFLCNHLYALETATEAPVASIRDGSTISMLEQHAPGALPHITGREGTAGSQVWRRDLSPGKSRASVVLNGWQFTWGAFPALVTRTFAVAPVRGGGMNSLRIAIVMTLLLFAPALADAAVPSCLKGMTARPLLAPYVAYLSNTPSVSRALGACRWAPGVLAQFQTKLAEAESAGAPPDAPIPAAFLTQDTNVDDSITATQTETEAILGAKFAHVLYVEVHRLVPWRLADYTDDDLARLFTPCKFPSNKFCSAATPSLMNEYVLDYSPRVAWSVVAAKLDLTALADPHATLDALLRHLRGFSHGGIYYDANGNVIKDTSGGIVTLDQMAAEETSRHGCWSTVPYLLGLAQALNIPGDGIYGYYAALGHATALFPFSNQVLSHGDDAYNQLLGATPSPEVHDTYAHWVTEILRYKPGDSRALYNSQKHGYVMARTYPSAYLMSGYCGTGGGRVYLDSTFNSYATVAQLDALEALILQTTAGCAAIPPDVPDP